MIIKKENIIISVERDFLKIATINPQQEKPVFPNHKKLVLHGIYMDHIDEIHLRMYRVS